MNTHLDKTQEIEQAALHYHATPRPGKLEIAATKPLGNQRDLALAYSPGVAAPCLEIADNPDKAAAYTARGNLVGVISNGTAVLGLGNIGPLASKPVMEGKAVLFKKFANIDVFDIEVKETDPERFCAVVAALEPTFGGINLEDIRAPDCFEIEAELRRRMKIPVFHDDQHGTAIIVAAAVLNGLELAGKKIDEAKFVASGAGAASLSCLNLLVALGARRENIRVTDKQGVLTKRRLHELDRWKAEWVCDEDAVTLDDIIADADVFVGLSAANILTGAMVRKMAERPLIMALANPTPEIDPAEALAACPDAMVCTGRSDFPNQVNNVLCFPFIFRGALDVGATCINEEMKRAAVYAIARLAKEESSEVVASAYQDTEQVFGPRHLIPAPFDPRLILRIAPAVARAAMESGVAQRPIDDFEEYKARLEQFVFRSMILMKPVFSLARSQERKIIYAEGEDERTLRAAQVLLADRIAIPVLVGRPSVIAERCRRYGLKIRPDADFECVNPESDPRYRDYVDTLVALSGRQGVSPDAARIVVRGNMTAIAALALQRGEADAMICGLVGGYLSHLDMVRKIIGLCEGAKGYAALSLLINNSGPCFLADTHCVAEPNAEEIAAATALAARQITRFGIEPRAALLSASNFGSRGGAGPRKMRAALAILNALDTDFQVDGEMRGDYALDEALRNRRMPGNALSGSANLLVFPNLDSANIALNLLLRMTGGLHVGPILLGAAKPAHILASSVTSRGLVNMSALAAVESLSASGSLAPVGQDAAGRATG